MILTTKCQRIIWTSEWHLDSRKFQTFEIDLTYICPHDYQIIGDKLSNSSAETLVVNQFKHEVQLNLNGANNKHRTIYIQ